MNRPILGLIGAAALVGGCVAFMPLGEPCPRYKLTTEIWRGQTVFWVYKANNSGSYLWCGYSLDTPALFRSPEVAEAAILERMVQPADTGRETTVKEFR